MSRSGTIHVVGAGLAGSECAFQLAEKGHSVVLHEMRPKKMTPAHKTGSSAELVCSNSFGSISEVSPSGQLKWEAALSNSLILKCALEARVPAGQALGMDREMFAELVHKALEAHPLIARCDDEITSIEEVPRPAVIATGPLTTEPLAKSLLDHFGDEFLYFFDAIAPILSADSINMDIAWKGSRWDKGTDDYINCPMNKEQYEEFIREVLAAEKVESKEFEKNTPYFEACMPIEVMAERGEHTPRFGPMRPVGLFNSHKPFGEQKCYAVVQLRQDNKQATAYNIVGFQTKMKYPEQKRIFRKIPGLEEAEFLKLGSIHRNMYIHSAKRLTPFLCSKNDPELFFAGQITGVEGYFESTCMGLLVAGFLDEKLQGKVMTLPPRASAMGSLIYAITQEEKDNFQPTNINFGLFPKLEAKMQKDLKKKEQILRARKAFAQWRGASLSDLEPVKGQEVGAQL